MLLLAFLPSESFTPSACAAHQSSRTAPRTAAVLASESDGPSPEEWREFRQKLVSGGLKLTTDVADEAEAADGAEPVRRAVAPKNEALLRSQSDELYQESAGRPNSYSSRPVASFSHSRIGSKLFLFASLSDAVIMPGPLKVMIPTLGMPHTRAAIGAIARYTS